MQNTEMEKNTSHRNIVFKSIIAGIFTVLPSFSPWLSYTAWVSFIPLLFVVTGCRESSAFLRGIAAGAAAGILYMFYVPLSTVSMGGSVITAFLFYIVLVCILAFYFGTFGAVSAFLYRRLQPTSSVCKALICAALFSCVWVSLEYILGAAFKGLPWVLFVAGHSQWSSLRIIQIASVSSVYSISFCMVFFNTSVFEAVRGRKAYYAIPGFTILALIAVYGEIALSAFEKEPDCSLKGAVLQANMGRLEKWDESSGEHLAKTYIHLAEEAAEQDPDIIVWPETAIPWPVTEGDDLIEAALMKTARSGPFHIIGCPIHVPDETGRYYNSALCVRPDGMVSGISSKINLLILAEKPLFGLSVRQADMNFVAGSETDVLNTPAGKAGVTVCNDNIYPSLSREFTEQGARFLINMSNDVWLPGSIHYRWHFVMNIFRSVENRRDTVVASNAGISGFISASGRIRRATEINKKTCVSGNIALRDSMSFYTAHGDFFPYICMFSSAAAAGLYLFKGKTV